MSSDTPRTGSPSTITTAPTDGPPVDAPAADPAPPAPPRRDRLQTVVALALLALFAAALVVLGAMRGDPHWDRLVFLLAGFEAVVFAAVGAFFGVTVQRGAVATARQAAAAADARAAAAETAARRRDEDAAADRRDAAAGRALAAAALAAAAPADRAGGAGADPDLAALARALFPGQCPPER